MFLYKKKRMPEYETNTVQYALLILEITVCIYF